MPKINELIINEKDDLLAPVKHEPGKAAMFRVMNSDVYCIAPLKKPRGRYDFDHELEGGKHWEQNAQYFEGAAKAELAYNQAIGKIDKEDINQKYR